MSMGLMVGWRLMCSRYDPGARDEGNPPPVARNQRFCNSSVRLNKRPIMRQKTGLCAKRVFPWQADQSPTLNTIPGESAPGSRVRSLLVYVAQAVHCSPRDAGDED